MRESPKQWLRMFSSRTRIGGGVALDEPGNDALSNDRPVQSAPSRSMLTPWAQRTVRNSVQEASDSLASRRKAI
jgi:hypothetical protein